MTACANGLCGQPAIFWSRSTQAIALPREQKTGRRELRHIRKSRCFKLAKMIG
jgi:hypothetical protein